MDKIREQLENRLKELQAESESGQKKLAEMDASQTSLRDTLLRISGAIQVLQEELEKTAQPQSEPAGPAQCADEEVESSQI